jgi:hypothetical protein
MCRAFARCFRWRQTRHNVWATTTSAPSICSLRSSARMGVAAKILERFGALDEVARVHTLALLEQWDADGHD